MTKKSVKGKAAPKARAPASKPPTRKRMPTEKGKAQQSKKNDDESDDDSSEDSDIDIAQPPSKTVLNVNWKDPTMSQKLIALIAENKEIKQALYPPCGPNASSVQGGGEPKVNAQFNLAVLLLGSIDKYKESIAAAALVPKDRLAYANKFKNRLGVMAKTTRDYNAKMGETGAGIEDARSIDMSKKNEFTTKWAEICAKCPWYFEMRNLIGQRPNLVPTGIGHSSTGVTAGVIFPAVHDDEMEKEEEEEDDSTSSGLLSNWDRTPEPTTGKRPFEEFSPSEFEFEDDGAAAGSDDDYEGTSPESGLTESSESGVALPSEDDDGDTAAMEEDVVKTKEVEVKKSKAAKATKDDTHPKKPAKPSTSNPAAASRPAKKTKLTDFSDIAKSEEKTRQREIELVTLRTCQQMKQTEVRGRIGEAREERKRRDKRGKQAERMKKLELQELKMKLSHELRMEGMRAESWASTSHAASNFFDSHSSGYASSEHNDISAFNGFDGNVLAGSSATATNTDFPDPKASSSPSASNPYNPNYSFGH
ncbi:hypothetical protein B0H19DRAFT_1383230 [Mycena capillaripes]|nr:hypothetical protein B0H19DRAFT_1383230 [Mycena capillaripes]